MEQEYTLVKVTDEFNEVRSQLLLTAAQVRLLEWLLYADYLDFETFQIMGDTSEPPAYYNLRFKPWRKSKA